MKRIGMVVAMREELMPLLESSGTKIAEEQRGAYTVTRLCRGEKELILVESGMGEIYAAGATQMLIDCYGVDAVINFGVCGTLSHSVGLLDTVLVEGVVHYAFDVSPICDCAVGQYPGKDLVLSCKNELYELVREIDPEMQSVICASADKFVEKAEEKRALADTFGASVCEMESAAVVLTCQNHGIPFLIVKAVSDGEGGAKDFAAMVERASRQYLELVYRVLERI